MVRDSDLWPWAWLASHPWLFATGFAFSLTLLGILLIHEFGHYFACRSHGINSTLPWVLPAPTLSGTAGAVIQIRSRIPTRDALMDVGIYGPLAGYIASAVAIARGLRAQPSRLAPGPGARSCASAARPLTIRLIHRAHGALDSRIFPRFNRTRAASHPRRRLDRPVHHLAEPDPRRPTRRRPHPLCHLSAPASHRHQRRCPSCSSLAGIFFWVGWILWGFLSADPRHASSTRCLRSTSSAAAALPWAASALLLFVLTFTPTPFYRQLAAGSPASWHRIQSCCASDYAR